MCGRYAFFSPAEAIKRVFALDDVPALEPRYNIAPTQDVAVVRTGEEGARAFACCTGAWCPMGQGARDRQPHDQRALRKRWRRSRRSARHSRSAAASCSPTAGTSGRSRPAASSPGSSAGRTRGRSHSRDSWERWKDPVAGSMLESCTIVTTIAAESIRKIDERMPVVLEETDWDRWTDTAFSDTGVLTELLTALRPEDARGLAGQPRGQCPEKPGPGTDRLSRIASLLRPGAGLRLVVPAVRAFAIQRSANVLRMSASQFGWPFALAISA